MSEVLQATATGLIGRSGNTIWQNGVDTHVLKVDPRDGISRTIPAHFYVYFNSEPSNVTISNAIDDSELDSAFAELYQQEVYKYDSYMMKDRTTFPGKLTEDIWVVHWLYHFKTHPMVEFTLTYDIDSTPHSYSFIVHNQKWVDTGDSMLPNDRRTDL